MAERFYDVLDSEGNIVARVIDNPKQRNDSFPVWIEVADGYQVASGKQQCHDRSEVTRLPVGRK